MIAYWALARYVNPPPPQLLDEVLTPVASLMTRAKEVSAFSSVARGVRDQGTSDTRDLIIPVVAGMASGRLIPQQLETDQDDPADDTTERVVDNTLSEMKSHYYQTGEVYPINISCSAGI